METPFFLDKDLSYPDPAILKFIRYDLNEHILTLTLARPEKRNAFNQTMVEEIAFVLGCANRDRSIRCVILKADGPVFCAGADLNAFLDSTTTGFLPRPVRKVNLGEAFDLLQKPSIAQIEGPVLAGGFLILCGVTFAYATPEATFSLPEVKRGLWPMQVMASLSKLVPYRKLMEMCITAQKYSAVEAERAGLLSGIIDAESIGRKIEEISTEIAANAPLAITRGMGVSKILQHHSGDASVFSMLQKELEKLLQTEDFAEGVQAFNEKRTPVWKNR